MSVDVRKTARRLGINPAELVLFGQDMAKVKLTALSRPAAGAGRLVLVSATTPTPAGEGKTTTSIGLAQALARLGEKVCLALREASLGPCLGMKGGATGGGRSSLVPADRINLHFTGDFHAVTSANNLLSAVIDNHIHQGNELGIDPRRILWRRVMDMNDRSLRHIVLGLGGPGQGLPREGGFDITAASEVMAMLCLAEDVEDLRRRIERTLVAFTWEGAPVYASQLKVTGAMLALLRDAVHPNLVQTVEGVPALVHGGPFANIAHGCSSLVATRLAMHLADWAITEAGFGFDLGAEKFFDIKCRQALIDTVAVVLVSTVRALKMHGGAQKDELSCPAPAVLERGLANLDKHIENVRKFNKEPVVALNRFDTDSDEEIECVRRRCAEKGVAFAPCTHFQDGGEGALELARAVIGAAQTSRPFRPLYPLEMPVEQKIRTVCREIYGAGDVAFTRQAERELLQVCELGFDRLPVCIAKAPTSLSDNPKLKGRPRDFDVTVRSVGINSGAGFLVVLTGDILRMPGLPRHPLAEDIDLKADGSISGL